MKMLKQINSNQLNFLLDAAEAKFNAGLKLIHKAKMSLSLVCKEATPAERKPELVLSVVENGKEKLVRDQEIKHYPPSKYDLWVNLAEMKLACRVDRKIITLDLVKARLSKNALRVLKILMTYPNKKFSPSGFALYSFIPEDSITAQILWKAIHDIRKVIQDGKTSGPWIKTARQIDPSGLDIGGGYYFEPRGSYCLISYISVDSAEYKESNQGFERTI